MTKPKPYKRYSVEFKKEAVRRASGERATDKSVCDDLRISTRQLQFRRWRYELEILSNNAFPGKGTSQDDEVTALKRELAKVKSGHSRVKQLASWI